MQKAAFIKTLSVFLILFHLSVKPGFTQRKNTKTKPNILLILADDMGWGDMRSHGNTKISTETLDRLLTESAELNRFYVSPVCAPTRASLLTGRYNLRTHVTAVTKGAEVMRTEEVTLAEMLKKHGYETGIFGKWHLGEHYPYSPDAQGFEEVFGFREGHAYNYYDPELEHNGKAVKTKGYIADVLTDAALSFMESNKNRPFFAYVPYNTPHAPYQAPAEYVKKYKALGFNDQTAIIYGMVQNMDENIARLLKRLDELQLAENTIVIFSSDNGPQTVRYNAGMKGIKGSVDEGGIRAPMIIRWPGKVQKGLKINQITAHIDIVPTLLEATGTKLKKCKTMPVDGKSLLPLLLQNNRAWPERMLFANASFYGSPEGVNGSVRTEKWRAVKRDNIWELYNMQEDPSQSIDVAKANTAELQQLSKAYESWFTDVIKQGFEKFPVPVGYKGADAITIMAPEAKLHGKVRWSGSKGYAHEWLRDWSTPADSVKWNIDVKKAGTYKVSLLYGADGEGIRVRLKEGGQTVEATAGDHAFLTKSADKRPGGKPDDLNWASLEIGEIRLKPGNRDLTFSLAAPLAENQKFYLNGIRLTRVD